MQKIYFLISIIFIILFFSCTNDSDITTYYFPVKQLESGKVYEYRFVGKPNINPQYWYYQTLKADPKASDKRGSFFTATCYDARFRIQQIVSEEVVSNGMLANDIHLYTYDSLENMTTLKTEIIAGSTYPFEVKDTTTSYPFQLKIKYPNDAIHTTTIIKNRRYKGKSSYTYKNKKYDCVVFEVKELVDDDLNGHWKQEFQTIEFYAKGIGLIYYKKNIGSNILEYELADIYEMSVLEKKISNQ